MSTTVQTGKKQRSAIADVVSRDVLLALSRRSRPSLSVLWYVPLLPSNLPDWFSRVSMTDDAMYLVQGTKDVRIDPALNKKVWEAGVKGVPFRLRVRISRKRNDEENAKEKLYSMVYAVNVKETKGLHTAVVDEE
ncbi:unnamed protein product [Aspergillus oryzae]|nr:unnamed protein product [Aspergillus oryzae]GMF85866.1 unnamed protein product [Aspergillus oryzae]